MSELVERVAKAMAERCRRGHDWPFWLDEARAAMDECAKIAGEVRVTANGHPQIDAPTPRDMQRAIVDVLRNQ